MAPLRETYFLSPRKLDGSVLFVEVETLILQVHGIQEHYNNSLSLTVRAVESWVGGHSWVIDVNPSLLVKHREEEISKVHISKLYPNRTLKQWGTAYHTPSLGMSLDQDWS